MDAIYDILDLQPGAAQADAKPNANDSNYLLRLSTLSLAELTTNEPASLSQSMQSHLRNLQGLSKRSHKTVISSANHLENLATILPSFVRQSRELRERLPLLESSATDFATKYERNTDNAVLDRRKRVLLLSRNADRVADVLDLPSLLASSVASAQSVSATSASSAAASYSAALDLSAHVKRLSTLYPQFDLVSDISSQAEAETQNLRSVLITSLQNPSLKLATAMRTIGWLRRLAPELTDEGKTSARDMTSPGLADGGLAALFLICRLRTLHSTLDALKPLRDLADQESRRRGQQARGSSVQKPGSAFGGQSERFLKRYIEIFREHSFNIISMYRSIFPDGLSEPDLDRQHDKDPFLPLPAPIVSFATHLVEMLATTLKQYLPNVEDNSARESLLTQVLYCAGSLGRLGAEFGMIIALLEEELSAEKADASAEPEWVQVMNKHRIQASRLEVLARGVGNTRKTSGAVTTLSAVSA